LQLVADRLDLGLRLPFRLLHFLLEPRVIIVALGKKGLLLPFKFLAQLCICAKADVQTLLKVFILGLRIANRSRESSILPVDFVKLRRDVADFLELGAQNLRLEGPR
jgi:hypothetical protein